MANNEFNVLDMVDEVESENNASEIFSTPIQKKEEPNPAKKPEAQPQPQTLGVVMKMEDLNDDLSTPLVNNADEALEKECQGTINDLKYKEAQIERAKARNNIKKLQIPDHIADTKMPDGALLRSQIMMAAGDVDEVAQRKLDEIFQHIKKEQPELILEYVDPSLEGLPTVANPQAAPQAEETEESTVTIDDEKLQVVIDKSNVTDIKWTEDDLAKIKKARTIELNIKDRGEVEFGTITNISGNAIDKVLAKYQRRTNDIVRALPASRYRATFTGLSYPEVLDLTVSIEMSTFDAEMKKWTIAFNHIKNPSIGPWESYYEYTDPATEKIIKMPINAEIPPGIKEQDVYRISEFDDFMRKTSYLDLQYILWCILCATAMETEIIQIKCNHVDADGKQCNNNYDWLYKPVELLSQESIPESVMEDIAKVSEAASKDEILKLYSESPVADESNYVQLPSSGFYVCYGHVSAYTYMDEIYGKVEALNKKAREDSPDPGLISKITQYTACQVIKSIIIKDEDGASKIKGAEDIVKIIEILDEIDWKTINELTELLVKPYTQFKYSIRGLQCPKCHTKSSIPIQDMSRLLFIVAQSLQSVQVKLTKN